MPPTLRTLTLGCKVNQYETQYVREGLLRAGYCDAADGEPADVCVVNTCTVTAEGEAKSRRAIRRLARENPGAKILVMGCYAARAPQEAARLPGVAEVVRDKRRLPELLARWGAPHAPEGLSSFPGRRRAYVKVQDGCLLRCTYCIIPRVRPQMISRPPDHVVREVRRLVDNGHQEIVLTGVHLGHYGVEWSRGRPKAEWFRLADLVRRLADLPGRFRIRLSSLEATEVTSELLDVMAGRPDKVCPHLHICLQSGSDAVLRRMGRRWGAQRLIDRCLLVRQRLDHPALTTDAMVGFPGETEADFEQTCEAVRRVGFAKVHVFPFSPRPGVPAAQMPGQIPPDVKRSRRRRLEAAAAASREAFLRSLVGRPMEVLVEGPAAGRPGWLSGSSARYAPVVLPGPSDWIGRLTPAIAQRVEAGRVVGSPAQAARPV